MITLSLADYSLPWLTIPAMLLERSQGMAERCALEDGDLALTYAQLLTRTRALASHLIDAGIRPQDRIGIWGPNSAQWVTAALACWWCGAIVVPVDAEARALEAVPLLQRAKVAALFFDDAEQGAVASWREELPAKVLIKLREAGIDESLAGAVPQHDAMATMPPAHQSAPDDVCEILFTSGSTGVPKGVLRTHRQVISNRHCGSQRRGFSADDVLLARAPFSHTLGLNGTLLRALMLGARVVIPRDPTPRGIAATIREHGVTAISAPPSLFAMLLDMEGEEGGIVSQLRLLSIGSDALSADLIVRLQRAGAGSIACGYGMTECDSISSATIDMGIDAVLQSVGTPEPGLEVRIAERDREVATNQQGEIQVKGYATTSGYLDDAVATAALYTDDGWLRTGDMGKKTSQGWLKILGRKKDVVISHGYTLYPAEIEALLLQSGMLAAVAVFGVPQNFGGESCAAAVVPRDPDTFSRRDLLSWARNNLTRYKVPSRVHVVAAIPASANGKVDRSKLLAQFSGQDNA